MSHKRLGFSIVCLIGLALLILFSVEVSKAGDSIWTWIGLLGAQEARAISIDTNNPQFIIVGISGGAGIYCSSDGGASWDACNSGAPSDLTVYDIEIARDDHKVIYASTNRGVLRSLDRASSWQVVLEGSMGTLFRTVSINPADNNLVLTTDEGSRVWRTIDGGESWEAVSLSEYAFAVEFVPSAPHIAYAAGHGAFRSEDFGEHWESANGGFVSLPFIESLAIDPYSGDVVYMASHDSLYRTADGGQSWTVVSNGLGSTDIRDIFIDLGNQQLIYIGSYEPPGVYRSLDSLGSAWQLLNAGMEGQRVMGIALNNTSPQRIYAGTVSNGIWEYTVTSGTEDYSVSINDGALFTNQTAVTLTLTAPAGTTELIISNDGGFSGATWESFAAQKPWTITAYGDYVIPRVVYTKFRTNGQTSGLYQDDIVLDVNAPTGSVEITDTVGSSVAFGPSFSVTILSPLTDTITNTVHLPLVMRNARPGFMLVGLTLSATDDVSGVGEMLISNNASFADAQWEAYTTRKDWWVSETETTTVYVKFCDRAGNESVVYFDTVTP